MSDATLSALPRKPAGQPVGSSLLSAATCAALVESSLATWWRWTSAGKTPRPIHVGGLTRWRRSDIDAWIEHGCPSRPTFDAIVAT